MKKLRNTLTVALLLIVTTFQAQEQLPAKVIEYGIGFSGLNNYSLQYRWGNENRLFRVSGNISALNAFGKNNQKVAVEDTVQILPSTSESTNKSPIDMHIGLGFSLLKLKFITEKFGVMYGPSLSASLRHSTVHRDSYGINYNNPSGPSSISTTSENTTQTITSSLGISLGMVYKINQSFFLYAEVTPNVFYTYLRSTLKTETYNHSRRYTESATMSNNIFGISNISNSGAMLTLAYRITR